MIGRLAPLSHRDQSPLLPWPPQQRPVRFFHATDRATSGATLAPSGGAKRRRR